MTAADFIERTLRRAVAKRTLRSAILKDSKAYERLHKQLSEAMTKAWDDQMRKGIANALDRLRDLGSGKFSAADAKTVLAVFEDAVGGPAIAAALREPVINLTDGIGRAGALEVGAAIGVDIAFNRADLDALDLIKRGNLFPVANSWDSVTRGRINPILQDYFTEGMTRQGLTERFAKDFADMTEKSRVYWELLADHMATKTREMGRVTGYERAGVTFVQVRAQLDDRTTKICRDLHGRVMAVAKLAAQRQTYLDAVAREDTLAANDAWVMHGVNADFSTSRTASLPASTGSPPYHFRCRTITVAYFPPRAPVDQWQQKLTDREPLNSAERQAVRDRAAGAGWISKPRARKKFARHRANMPTRRLADYEADARALINHPDAQLALSSRVPKSRDGAAQRTPHAVYSRPAKNRNTGEAGYLVSVVELDENVIVSHHWRDNRNSENDAIPGVILKRKGLMQWLFS